MNIVKVEVLDMDSSDQDTVEAIQIVRSKIKNA